MKNHLYGKQTEQSLENFPFPYHKVSLDLIYGVTLVKKAAAIANEKAGGLVSDKAKAIVKACDEILKGKHDDQFVTCALQGGAGTSINMNVNEVIASLSNTHQNDDVNMSQSTNDVNPAALKITCITLIGQLLENLDQLINEFETKAKLYKHVIKLGRTHWQDAVPTTMGEEMKSYADVLRSDRKRIVDILKYFYEIGLGGTAIGNSINASKEYIKEVYKQLCQLTNYPIKQSNNFMPQTSSQSDFCHLSAVITILCLDLSKIAGDIRFMASGPKGGIGEIKLQPLQPGSSIMPGKVNPVMPEAINQLYYLVNGKNETIHEAAHDSNLELGNMFPILADSLISMLQLTATGIRLFNEKCIKTMKVDEERCRELLEKSTAYATLLTPVLGYDTVSVLVKEAINENKTIREKILEKKLMTEKEFNKIISA